MAILAVEITHECLFLQTPYAFHSCYKSQPSKSTKYDAGRNSSKRKHSRSHLDVGGHKTLASELTFWECINVLPIEFWAW
jgi:hypothetical protein